MQKQDCDKNVAQYYEKEHNTLLRYIRRRLHSASDMDVEDILHEVFVRIYNRADVSYPIENLAAYVYRSLQNRVADYLRKKQCNPSLEQMQEQGDALQEMLSDARLDPAQAAQRAEFWHHLSHALDTLEPRQRTVWIATEIQGMSFGQLSAMWDEPIGTLLSRKSRATKKLRQELQDFYDMKG